MAATPVTAESKNQFETGARIKLEPSWRMRLKDDFASEQMARLREFLEGQYAKGKTVFPKRSEFFAALDATPFDQVKVVILGQDPYHGPGQAHGLCFSVREGTPHPPSLQNILKEVSTDLGVPLRKSGSLAAWARQGVLLLNATLTVEAGAAGSHQGKGWEWFTDRIVDLLNREREHLVFILWGAYAQRKGQYIDRRRHLVLEAPHPSPLSAHRGFFGSRPFSATNRYLKQHGIQPIDWSAE